MNLAHNNLKRLGFPIRKSPDHCLFASFPKLIASYYVLYRLLLPRHPPYALYLLDYVTLNDFMITLSIKTLEYLNWRLYFNYQIVKELPALIIKKCKG